MVQNAILNTNPLQFMKIIPSSTRRAKNLSSTSVEKAWLYNSSTSRPQAERNNFISLQDTDRASFQRQTVEAIKYKNSSTTT